MNGEQPKKTRSKNTRTQSKQQTGRKGQRMGMPNKDKNAIQIDNQNGGGEEISRTYKRKAKQNATQNKWEMGTPLRQI